MNASDIQCLDHTVRISHAMIDELDQHLGWNDKPRSYRLLMAVLHAAWEWLSVDENGSSAGEFPVRLCGSNYDQWPASAAAIRSRSMEDFIARVDVGFKPDPMKDPLAAIAAVLGLLSEKVSEHEVADIRRALPAELQRACSAFELSHRCDGPFAPVLN